MISVIARLFIKLSGLLPQDPFKDMVPALDSIADFMGYLNWFIPFKPCIAILGTWTACMTAWYIFKNGKDVIDRIV